MNYELKYAKRKADLIYVIVWGLLLVVGLILLFLSINSEDNILRGLSITSAILNLIGTTINIKFYFGICLSKRVYISIDEDKLLIDRGVIWMPLKVPIRNITEVVEVDKGIRVHYIDEKRIKIKMDYLAEDDIATLMKVITKS